MEREIEMKRRKPLPIPPSALGAPTPRARAKAPSVDILAPPPARRPRLEPRPSLAKSTAIEFYAKMSEVPQRTLSEYDDMYRELVTLCARVMLSRGRAVQIEEDDGSELECLPYYRLDARCAFIARYEEKAFVGGSVVLCASDHVSLCDPVMLEGYRHVGFLVGLLRHLMAIFPGTPVYVVTHEEDARVLDIFGDAFKVTTGEVFYVEEHPSLRGEDGYVGSLLTGN